MVFYRIEKAIIYDTLMFMIPHRLSRVTVPSTSVMQACHHLVIVKHDPHLLLKMCNHLHTLLHNHSHRIWMHGRPPQSTQPGSLTPIAESLQIAEGEIPLIVFLKHMNYTIIIVIIGQLNSMHTASNKSSVHCWKTTQCRRSGNSDSSLYTYA